MEPNPNGRIRVLIVDDAVVMRRVISEALAQDESIEVVGTAANGRIALAKLDQVKPDVVTLDVEMPEMDGVETVREIRKRNRTLPVIMFSTLTQRGAVTTLEALSAGASDYVTKPANVGSVMEGFSRLRLELIPKIKALCRRGPAAPAAPAPNGHAFPAGVPRPPSPTPVARPASPVPSPAPATGPAAPPDALCIGSSTGGPNALVDVFNAFPAALDVPVLVVQHMPPLFTQMLAERLDRIGNLRFCEGAQDMPVRPGHVYIAPGGRHMEVVRVAGSVRIRLHDGPSENSCRPAVDVLLRSAVEAYNGRLLVAILTGMGYDGLRGSETARRRGAQIVAQDEATSVVWGMPGAVVHAGLADRVLPLNQIGPELVRRVSVRRPSVPTLPAAVPVVVR
jgi:two-component system chemotaxis response regulator CheB